MIQWPMIKEQTLGVEMVLVFIRLGWVKNLPGKTFDLMLLKGTKRQILLPNPIC